MKKLLSILLAVVLVFSLAGCSLEGTIDNAVNDFKTNVQDAVNDGVNDVKDAIGVTEHVKLSYGSGNMGGFSERTPFEREWYEEPEKDQPEETNDEIELVPSCENTIANAYNEDDEFDDFLDDDDDDC